MMQTNKLTRIFLLLILGILFSCNSNDDQNDPNTFETDIIGIWELTSATSNGEELVEFPNCLDRLTFTETTVKYLEYFDFNDGNGCVIVSGQMIEETFPYSINGVDLFWDEGDAELFEYEIIELNSTTLKLQEVYTEGGETFTDIETYNRL